MTKKYTLIASAYPISPDPADRVILVGMAVDLPTVERWLDMAEVVQNCSHRGLGTQYMVAWGDVTFYTECPLPPEHPAFALVCEIASGVVETSWTLVAEDAIPVNAPGRVRTDGDYVQVWSGSVVAMGRGHYSDDMLESDSITIQAVADALRAEV
jgi:hypothetical protein